jgi:predicted alpha/beta-fold hydrolase
MPVNDEPAYRAPFPWFGGHLQTITSGLSRRSADVQYVRERIDTPDGDFLDLDWARRSSSSLVVIAHGLEGHSRRPYVLGMARAFNSSGYDALVWNFRGCSGEPNRLLRSYHSGCSDDLQCVIEHVLEHKAYDTITLVGFSLGGNICLKYLGEQGAQVPKAIVAAVALSVPCDLRASALRVAEWSNRLYLRRFLRTMRQKIRDKDRIMPGKLNLDGIEQLRDFGEFDDRFTAPLNGFANAEEYWRQCSSRQFLDRIRLPTLIINARNDPFLTPACFPVEEAMASEHVCLEMPRQGGHVGFPDRSGEHFWSEKRALKFAQERTGI